MATRLLGSKSFWQRLRGGPWDKPVVDRIEVALETITRRLRASDDVIGIVVFGSYARGDFGRKSDLDLLVILRPTLNGDQDGVRRHAINIVSEVESETRLPVHIAPFVTSAGDPDGLGAEFLHELWTDGVVLYGEASTLAMLQPSGLAPWSVVRFSLDGTLPKERVRLARRLHGTRGKPGIIRLPGLNLSRGAALVPAEQTRAVRDALDDAGAVYDIVPVWREV